MAQIKIVAARLFRWAFMLITFVSAIHESTDSAVRIVCALFAVACWFDWRLMTRAAQSFAGAPASTQKAPELVN